MNVLVAAASRHGATIEIAQAIAATLERSNVKAEVMAPDAVESLSGYGAVVLGSAVYMGHWLDPAKRFVDRFASDLAIRPVWLFSSGPIGDPPKPDEEPVDVARLRNRTGARDHRLFLGKLSKGVLGFSERAIAAAFRAPEGDFRSWPEVEKWASGIARVLREGPVPVPSL